MRSLVFAPSFVAGGVKSLYSVCEWLDRFAICLLGLVEPTRFLIDPPHRAKGLSANLPEMGALTFMA